MKQNTVYFERQGFLAKGSIYLINKMNLILRENQTQTKITERFIALVDYNRGTRVLSRFDFVTAV